MTLFGGYHHDRTEKAHDRGYAAFPDAPHALESITEKVAVLGRNWYVIVMVAPVPKSNDTKLMLDWAFRKTILVSACKITSGA